MTDYLSAYEVQREQRIRYNNARLAVVSQLASDTFESCKPPRGQKVCKFASFKPREVDTTVSVSSPAETRIMSGATGRNALSQHITKKLTSLGKAATDAVPAILDLFVQQTICSVAALEDLDDAEWKELLDLRGAVTVGVKKALKNPRVDRVKPAAAAPVDRGQHYITTDK